MAFKRLLIEKFAPAVDFYFWVDVVNAKDFSLPWYGKHLERHSMELRTLTKFVEHLPISAGSVISGPQWN